MIKRENRPSTQLLKLLKDNVIGTPGKSMLYQHQLVEEKLKHIPKPHFINLYIRKKLIGTSCFCEREVIDAGNQVKGYYVRYFSFLKGFRSKGNRVNNTGSKGGKIRKELKKILNESETFLSNPSDYFYAYVAPDNIRSKMLCEEFGFKKVREFSTLLFSRFFPKIDSRFSKLPKERKEEVRSLLKEYYGQHTMLSFENYYYNDNYFILENDTGEVLAGVQANPEHWKVLEMPGITGWLAMNLLPFLPLMGRLFNKDYRFLSLEAIYLRKGHEMELQNLISSVLKHFGLYTGMIWADNQSDLYNSFKKNSPGLLQKLNKEITADVIVKTPESEINPTSKFVRNPAYISSFDLT